MTVDLSLKLYCRISDHAIDGSSEALSQNTPLPKEVKEKIEQTLKTQLEELILTEKQTGCDFLKIKEKLYRKNFKQYSKYKDNFLSVMKYNVSVSVDGQK